MSHQPFIMFQRLIGKKPRPLDIGARSVGALELPAAVDAYALEPILPLLALADGTGAEHERPGPWFTEQVLREAAAEVGLDGVAVARAAAEERLEVEG